MKYGVLTSKGNKVLALDTDEGRGYTRREASDKADQVRERMTRLCGGLYDYRAEVLPLVEARRRFREGN
ncbi:MAG: hypothetical protein HWN51_06570 [Desulfobacterales bacterium]|nr:hypothetical protein [Desulfobacterales bacterium]